MKLDYDRHQRLIQYFNQDILDARTACEIQGVAAAIVYDEALDESELALLKEWMLRHKEQAHAWPLSDLYNMFEEMLRDGRIDDTERLTLLDFLSAIACSSQRSGQAADNIFDEHVTITFPSRTFLFTGKLESGPRKQAQSTVQSLGGICHENVRVDTDFLIVGALGTEFWKTSRYGTKIEAVMRNRHTKSAGTRIVREVDYSRAVVSQRVASRAANPPPNRS